jgi:hypothetical protein
MAATRTLVPSAVPSFRLPAAGGGLPLRTPSALSEGSPAPRALPASARPAPSSVPSFRVPSSGTSPAASSAPAGTYTGFGNGGTGAPSHPGGLAGLLSNAEHIVTGFPGGIAHFVGDALTDVAVVPHVAFDVATGNFKPDIARYLPATTGIVKSFGHTAGDIVNPTHFISAYQHGDLLSKILEDVGNVALVGGTAAKVIGAGAATSAMTASDAAALRSVGHVVSEATPAEIARAGLPELSTAAPEGALGEISQVGKEPLGYYTGYKGLAGRVAQAGDFERAAQLNALGNKIHGIVSLGEKAASAPAAIYTKPANWALEQAGVEGGLKGALESAVNAVRPHLPAAVQWRLSPEGVTTGQTAKAATAAGIRVESQALAPHLLADELGLTGPENHVAVMAKFLPKDLLRQYGQLDDRALADVLNHHFQDFTEATRPTVEDARVAAKWADDQLPLDTMKNIERVGAAIDEVAKNRTDRYIAGGGDPNQLGSTLLPSEVARHTADLQFKRDQLSTAVEKAQTQADRHGRNLQVKDVLANDLPDPSAMARPEIRSQLTAKRAQLADLARQRDEAVARGDYRAERATDAQTDVVLNDISDLERQAGWIRYKGRTQTGEVTEPPSANERIRQQQGTLAERHARALQTVNRLQGRISTIDERMANVETDLRQKFQDTYHTKVNLPSITRLTNAMFRGTSRLPTLLRRLGRDDLATAVNDGSLAGDQVIRQLESDGHALTDTQRSQLEHSVKAEDAAAQIADHMESLRGDTSGQRLISPVEVKDIIDQAALPGHTMPAVESAYDSYLQRRASVMRTVLNDQTAAMPAKYRSAAMWAQRHVSALIDQGIKDNADVPGSGNEFLKQAEETATTLQQMVDAGFNPTHLIGGEGVTPGQAASRGYANGRLTQTKYRSDYTRGHGIQQLSTDANAALESQQARTWVKNKRNEYLDATLGKQLDSFPHVQNELAAWADKHPGEVMPSAELKAAIGRGQLIDENGVEHKAIDPAANVTPESRVVPAKVFDAFQDPGPMGAGWRALQKTNSAFKTWVLPFSGKWQTGNAVGNVLQAAMHAGVGPVELARLMHGLVKEQGGFRETWRNEGLMPGLPRTLSESGLTHAEMAAGPFGAEMKQPGTPIGKFAQGSYKFNSTVDNLTRSSVYLAKLMEGQGSEAAMKTTMRALGDYTSLTPLERNKIRQVVPFYTWLKHSITATLRLPITSPTRAAFFAHLSTMYKDDPNLQSIVGQGMRIGNTGILDFGTGNPLADFGSDKTMFNPMNWGGALSPTIKLAASLPFGIDLQKMARLTRPGSTGPATGNISPLSQLFHNPAAGLGEIAWQLTQQGPTQVRALRDYVLGDQTRYGGTGYRSGFTDPNRRNPWQAARILSLPNIRYDPRLAKGS